ncbi:hypothetical protein [Stutzerimonas stutzeri]|uniref:hypothetical protein n=1 Tax=Stutzerimonas stutzeri TaxID=316 RepID=UPI00210B4949|nr:hypothetical protein [Stutzerimonas stutzeri]MCQ4257979.1 hypothetical protein [Stutzerimonas stutzeri]
MHQNHAQPDGQTARHQAPTHRRRRRRRRWLNLLYALGLLLVFLISLLLLPADAGVGKLLGGALAAC